MATNAERSRRWAAAHPGYWRTRNKGPKRAADKRYREKNRERLKAYLKAWRAKRSPEKVAADKAAQQVRTRRAGQLRRLRESVEQRKNWRRSMHAINRAIRRWKTPEQLEAA